jgi:tRNA pseudouridine55 synthase
MPPSVPTSFCEQDKTYEATVTLGATSTTGDTEGEVIPVSDVVPSEESVRAALATFNGLITQTPPAFSAIKIGGQRAYKLARKGTVVDMPTRQVTIHSLELLSYDYPHVRIRTNVSSGTYIRSLAEDIGTELGVGGGTAANYAVRSSVICRSTRLSGSIPSTNPPRLAFLSFLCYN